MKITSLMKYYGQFFISVTKDDKFYARSKLWFQNQSGYIIATYFWENFTCTTKKFHNCHNTISNLSLPLPSLSTWLFTYFLWFFFCRNRKSFSSAKKAIRDNSCTFEMTDRTRSILAFVRSKSFIIRVSKLSLSNTITHALWLFFNNFVQKMF